MTSNDVVMATCLVLEGAQRCNQRGSLGSRRRDPNQNIAGFDRRVVSRYRTQI
ncbi:hypothetical protein M758_6G023000 [Ceratodon purpureus]|uniref:Uncharacterized protein n=1 Tax=Ceratodon purpureus TaxID=3225 RepID=A0A8T0HC80_CERPU|nr:hypothetical protein KC19_6G025600 [Ceratodon purpureus]KAG0612383.1 hypothetical protein M758_6G023000 [Ceratodon purpureus]